MNILIANPGSTSYKCKLLDNKLDSKFEAVVERIGSEDAILSYSTPDREKKTEYLEIRNYTKAVEITIDILKKEKLFKQISAIGFKTVLAKNVTGCVEIDEKVVQAIEEYIPLAPVHNKVYLKVINIFRELIGDIPLIGKFETSFHTEIPAPAYLYGIPYKYYEKYGIRKYGFHGASHEYIAETAANRLGSDQEDTKIISCHLGGSSSVCAIKNGVSVDTSMGMSPQSGLLNANRTGDLDPYALLYLQEKENLTITEIRDILGSQSGVAGISGIGGDFRDIKKAMEKGNKRAELAFKTYAYFVRRYIGEYLAVLNGADAIVFTAGIGVNNPSMRKEILKNMENLGIVLDDNKNKRTTNQGIISGNHSKIAVYVIPTNEELIVARKVKEYFRKN
jgi:acetate kinase